ncbi:inactive rhomboid protein 1-like isoform X2 [Mytilus trossulus]|uniref:inactive rhomboid protein 1-like isoform X2 n=1 Tax=Mytilus trossulus TaxID=6551 RepID=UPI003005B82C
MEEYRGKSRLIPVPVVYQHVYRRNGVSSENGKRFYAKELRPGDNFTNRIRYIPKTQVGYQVGYKKTQYNTSNKMDRQFSRMTTASAPGTRTSSTTGEGKFNKASRKLKKSLTGFFGLDLDDEHEDKKQRWNNRRMRLYKGKVKDDYLLKAESDDLFLENSHQFKYIHDPLRRVHRDRPSEMSSRRTTPLSSSSTYARSRPGGPKRLRKDSVMQMTWKGLRTIAASRKKLRGKSYKHSASFDPARMGEEFGDDLSASYGYAPQHEDAISLVDDVFYDEPIAPPTHKMSREYENLPAGGWRRQPPQGLPSTPYDELDMPEFCMRRINPQIMNNEVGPETRQVGMGFVGRLFNRSFRSDRMNSNIKSQIANVDDHRPYFTFWVTFVQLLVFIVSIAVYGIAPIGVSERVYEESVMMPNLAFEKVRFSEAENLWIGPKQADLIHLGAKYSPCMRKDENIYNGIAKDLVEEKTSGCCIRNDGSGCVQSVRSKCSTTISEFKKYNSTNPSSLGFLTGAVCGQDPKYCKNPASVAPFEWNKNDITNWPFCEDTNAPLTNTSFVSGEDRHMTCELSGRPCCHGIQGECMITTREHCNFMQGYYHEDKFLCSQVKCLKQICGMIPFTDDDIPDQFYRLWTSIFLHGGLFHLLITIGFQMLIMRDVEKLTGCIRMTIIYVGSGIAGNLASSTFLPYHVEVGPAGAQFGILACLLVEAIQSIQMLKRPCLEVTKVLLFIGFLFLLGLLPWIDNWAHLTGFVFGFLLAFAILPYIHFGSFDKTRKCVMILFGLGGATILFVMLIILFYISPIYNCPGCQYFNCIPITENFCKNMEVQIDRESTYTAYL